MENKYLNPRPSKTNHKNIYILANLWRFIVDILCWMVLELKKLILSIGILLSVAGGTWHIHTGNTASLIITAIGAGCIAIYMAQSKIDYN